MRLILLKASLQGIVKPDRPNNYRNKIYSYTHGQRVNSNISLTTLNQSYDPWQVLDGNEVLSSGYTVAKNNTKKCAAKRNVLQHRISYSANDLRYTTIIQRSSSAGIFFSKAGISPRPKVVL